MAFAMYALIRRLLEEAGRDLKHPIGSREVARGSARYQARQANLPLGSSRAELLKLLIFLGL